MSTTANSKPPTAVTLTPAGIVKSLASLRLTVSLLVFAMAIIFFATLDQVNLGIHFVQEKYFQSWVVWGTLPGLRFALPLLPGGYAIGALLLINLLCAHALRFKFTGRKVGVALIHSGLILLILGQFFTGITQKETQMRMDEGQTKNYSESPRDLELAISDITDPAADVVTVIPAELLRPGEVLSAEALPFTLRVAEFFPNSRMGMKGQGPEMPPTPEVNMGLGTNFTIWSVPRAVKDTERDIASVWLDVLAPDGKSLGKWLASNAFHESPAPVFQQPQVFQHSGRTYRLELRPRREYKPFQLTLLEFTHERYAGTQIPKNFSSRVRLYDAPQGEDRQVLIFMNNPLRYGGYTFYQAGFDNDDTTTVLQVVTNPFWLTPYLACLLVTVGMTWQFSSHLLGFMAKRRKLATASPSAPRRRVPHAA